MPDHAKESYLLTFILLKAYGLDVNKCDLISTLKFLFCNSLFQGHTLNGALYHPAYNFSLDVQCNVTRS